MTQASSSQRYLSVDVLRGLTVAFMILVNDPGDWSHVFTPLDHAEWNGWTVTDLVFPTFLFLVGCSVVFAVRARLRRGVAKTEIVLQVLRRAAVLILLKLFLSALPFFHLGHLRIFGVLTRIALCYAAAALLFVWTERWRTLLGITVALLLGYWLLLRFVPVPGYGMPGAQVPFLDPDGNLASYIDRGFNDWTQHWLHTGSLYRKTRDPEGLLSTLPSIATTLLGVLAGLMLVRRSSSDPDAARKQDAGALAAAGALCIVLGEAWSLSFPINKNMWTSSYVLLAGGIALVLLAACHLLLDGENRPAWLRAAEWPWLVFGSNAIFAYSLSSLLAIALGSIKVAGAKSLHGFLYHTAFARNGSTQWTSLAWAVVFVIACFLPTWFLWRRKWLLRI